MNDENDFRENEKNPMSIKEYGMKKFLYKHNGF